MTKKKTTPGTITSQLFPASRPEWFPLLKAVAQRYDQEYQGQAIALPDEVEAMPLFQDWATGKLQNRIATPFWELVCPKKNEQWLDLGCGLSFLIYPWRDWQAYFYGQEISTQARDILQSRGPQLNSKLFRGVQLAGAHQLSYPETQFDGVVWTGWSCYYPLDYAEAVFKQIKSHLKPKGVVILDVLNPESAIAEDWAILETFLGSEVQLTPLKDWDNLIKAMGGTRAKTRGGELFETVVVRF